MSLDDIDDSGGDSPSTCAAAARMDDEGLRSGLREAKKSLTALAELYEGWYAALVCVVVVHRGGG